MVRAILDGRKTQTRRVIKPQPTDMTTNVFRLSNGFRFEREEKCRKYRYGQSGDELWVKETWNNDWCSHIIYRADGGSAIDAGYDSEPKWRPSIFMPRVVSRIQLLITGMWIERLQNISESDIAAEGVDIIPTKRHFNAGFKRLWNAINAQRGFGWDMNPWVWVIEFKLLDSSGE